MILEIKFLCINFWGYKIFTTKNNNLIVNDGNNFYTLSDPNDIDSDPYKTIDNSKIKIVDEFSDN